MPLSSPISWRAMRPSCVSTSRPVESMSSRPAGAKPRSCCRREPQPGGIALPVIALLHQHHGRLVAVLGLPAHVTDRLVQQDRDLLALLAPRLRIHLDACVGRRPATPSPRLRRRPAPSPWRSSRRPRAASTGPARPCACSVGVVGEAGSAIRPMLPARTRWSASASRSRMRRPPYSTRMVDCASSAASASLTLWRDSPTRYASSCWVMRSTSPTPG